MFEALAVISGIVTLVQGTTGGALGIVLAILVIVTLFHQSVTDWFEAKAAQRNQV